MREKVTYHNSRKSAHSGYIFLSFLKESSKLYNNNPPPQEMAIINHKSSTMMYSV